jgi:hypothetical protein
VPRWREQLHITAERNVALYESTLSVSGKRVFVDTSKGYRRAVLLARYAGLQARVIHLIRDAPGYVNSCRKNLSQSTEESCAEWLVMHRRAALLRKTLPREHWLVIRYEDLCADPLGSFAKICQFLGTHIPGRLPDPENSTHHIRGNRMRLKRMGEIRLDSSWQAELPVADIDYVERHTLAVRRMYGYTA